MAKTVYEILGENIRKVRKHAGLSQEYVGQRLNMSRSGYGYYERGERE